VRLGYLINGMEEPDLRLAKQLKLALKSVPRDYQSVARDSPNYGRAA
jgi:hypothetical protein